MLGDGSQTNPYILTQPSDFDVIRTNIANDVYAYYELGNDIDFENVLTKSINYLNANKRFLSSFDGKGYTIKNLNFHNPTLNVSGFFGNSGATTIVKNVKFENMRTKVANNGVDYSNVSLLTYALTGTWENIYMQGEIDFTGRFVYFGGVGAVTSYTNTSSIKNIYSEIDITVRNGIPHNTNSGIGGFSGTNAYGTSLPTTVGNIVVNNTLTLINTSTSTNIKYHPFAFISTGTFVQYDNLYANESNFFKNVDLAGVTLLTDDTIKQPLELDSNAWIQKNNDIPQLRMFADLTNRFTVHATSSMRGINSISSVNKKKSVQSNTYINPIVSDTTKFKRKHSHAISHISPITSKSTYIDYLIRLYKVSSSISPISAKVDSSKRKEQITRSYIDTITTDSQSSKSRLRKTSTSFVKPINATTTYNFKRVPIYREIELDVSYQLHKSVISALEWKSILSADKRTRNDI